MFNLQDLSEHGIQSVSEQEIGETVIGLEENEVNLINFIYFRNKKLKIGNYFINTNIYF